MAMIPLYVIDGVAYVWNAEDWYTLRTSHRICGTLTGALSSFSRQNDFQGLPMLFTSEESALLVDEGICELYILPNLDKTISDELKQQISDTDKSVVSQQTQEMKKRKIEQLSQKIDIIVSGKKQKLLSKGIVDVNIDKNVLLQEEINKIPNIASANLLVHLPTQHYIDTEKIKVSIDVLKPSVAQGHAKLKYVIFRDLWKKGFYITNGFKFGCDFLVYPGDPVRFHATYMVRCTNVEAVFRPASLVAFGRLSVAVNKLAVLAYFNSLNQIEYQTMQWHDTVNNT